MSSQTPRVTTSFLPYARESLTVFPEGDGRIFGTIRDSRVLLNRNGRVSEAASNIYVCIDESAKNAIDANLFETRMVTWEKDPANRHIAARQFSEAIQDYSSERRQLMLSPLSDLRYQLTRLAFLNLKMGEAYCAMGKPDQAIVPYQSAALICTNLCGSDHRRSKELSQKIVALQASLPDSAKTE